MIPVLLLWLLAVIGVPLFALFAAASLGLLLDQPGGGWEAAAIDVFGARLGDSPTLMTVPLLALAGLVLAEAGMGERLLALARTWLGWMPRALVAASWLLCALGTTLGSGHATAGCALLLLPALHRLRARRWGDEVAGEHARSSFVLANALRALRGAQAELAVPLLFGVSVALGLRAYEAATLAALLALCVEGVVQRRLDLRRELPRVVHEAVSAVGVVLAVAITAIGFHSWLVHAEAGAQLIDWLDRLGMSRTAFLLIANALLLAACWLLDVIPALLLVAPLLLPAADQHLVDVYELAIVFLFNAELARLAGWPPARPGRPASQLQAA